MSDADRPRPERFFDPILRHPLTRKVAGGVAAAGLATALFGASPAEAQDPVPYGGGGIFIGYTWGPGGGVNWGIEGRIGADFRDQFACSAQPAFSTAATARFGFVDLTPQLHVGGQAGVSMGPLAWMGDVSLGYRWGEDGGFSVPIGFEMQVHFASTYIRADPALWNFSVGGAVSYPPREGEFFCAVAGRALHDEMGHAGLPAVTPLAEGRRATDLDADTADALAAEWEHRAKAEWASVPAFLQLADQLRLAGAPRGLVLRALAAAQDEARHAIGTARASMVYAGAPVQLGAVTPATRAHATGREALVRLAVESWVDGCLGEGKAAAAVAREAELAPEPALRELQETISADEARHAELAWDVLAWAVAAGGDDVRHAVDACREATPMEGTSGLDGEVDLSAHGLLSEDAHGAIGMELREASISRLDAILG